MTERKQETISRIRNLVKGVSNDAFLTDRFLYSLALKYAKLFIKRLDEGNRLGRYNGLFQPLAVELVEVSTTGMSCADIKTCCTIMRTKETLPKILNGCYGPIIRDVSSVDGSQVLQQTYGPQYARMTKTTTFKYNKYKYYFLENDYAYFPNISWEEVMFLAMWEDDIEEYRCCSDNCCADRLSEPTNIPDFLFADIEGPVRQELLNMIQIPADKLSDNQNILKS